MRTMSADMTQEAEMSRLFGDIGAFTIWCRRRALHGSNKAVGIQAGVFDLQAFKKLPRSSPRLRLEPFREFSTVGE